MALADPYEWLGLADDPAAIEWAEAQSQRTYSQLYDALSPGGRAFITARH